MSAESLVAEVRESAKSLHNVLKETGMTLSVAESCTGGMIGSFITELGGSSSYFVGGCIAYSNNIKIKILNVDAENLEKLGAVSGYTAGEMAKGVRIAFESDIGISVTGIAGPEGGSEDKPVGTVWMGFSCKDKTCTEHNVFEGDRDEVRLKTVKTVFDLLLQRLLKSRNG